MHFGVTLNDLGNLTTIGLRMLFYLSGIFYNINEMIGGALAFVLLKLNFIAFCINELRTVTTFGTLPSFIGMLVWLLIGLLLCTIGASIIHKNENSYAKVI
jgi:ABC-type polysaccharide/polyol phosphate export permease